MTVDVIFEDTRWEAAGLAQLAEVASDATLRHLGYEPEDWELCVMGCDDARIAELNEEFRDKGKATNVLSWPSEERGLQKMAARRWPRKVPTRNSVISPFLLRPASVRPRPPRSR